MGRPGLTQNKIARLQGEAAATKANPERENGEWAVDGYLEAVSWTGNAGIHVAFASIGL